MHPSTAVGNRILRSDLDRSLLRIKLVIESSVVLSALFVRICICICIEVSVWASIRGKSDTYDRRAYDLDAVPRCRWRDISRSLDLRWTGNEIDISQQCSSRRKVGSNIGWSGILDILVDRGRVLEERYFCVLRITIVFLDHHIERSVLSILRKVKKGQTCVRDLWEDFCLFSICFSLLDTISYLGGQCFIAMLACPRRVLHNNVPTSIYFVNSYLKVSGGDNYVVN